MGLGQLEIRQRTLTQDAFDTFQDQLKAGSITLDLLVGYGAPRATVKVTRAILQRALGHTAARVTTYYSLPDIVGLIEKAEGGLERLLSLLERELNLPFKSSYAARLGNFEIFHLNPWLDTPQPFLVEAASPPPNQKGASFQVDWSGHETLEICRTPAFADTRHLAHVTGRVHGDVVINRLIFLEPGQFRVPVDSPEWVDQLDFQLFDETGQTLLHSEQNTYITRIGLVMAPITRQVTIQDDLSGRAAQKGLGKQASTVHVHTSHRSMVGGPAEGSWRKFAEDMNDLVAAQLPSPGQDKWFPRSIEGEVGLIAHFNQLLNGGQIRRAVLVDPWFGADALRAFALRLASQDVHLTIVTSWTRRDPDTGVPFGPDRSATAELEAALRQIESFLNPRLTVINMADGSDQAFHDRYLLLYPHEGASKIYLLSNSLNRAAGNWPFCMSLLSADAGLEVRRYIEGLCDGQDIARGKSLAITFKWPNDAV
ncbi:VPA1262 family N-terminal domain-containing protein [Bradyrhizobium sp. USDA 4501]